MVLLSLSNRAYSYILKKISNAEYLEGFRLNISQISQELHMSRTPVNAAIEELIQRGYLKKEGSHILVSASDLAEASDIAIVDHISILFDLAIMVANYIFDYNIFIDFEDLEKKIENLTSCIESENIEGFYDVDSGIIHAFLSYHSNKLYAEYGSQSAKILDDYYKKSENIKTYSHIQQLALKTYQTIYDLLKAGDKDETLAYMEESKQILVKNVNTLMNKLEQK